MTGEKDTTPVRAADVGVAKVRGPLLVPHGYDRGQCRGCGARDVFWVKLVDALGDPKISRNTGKQSRMLLNLGTVKDGNVVLERVAGTARVFSHGEWVDPGGRYEPHFATCPHAREFRTTARR